jgi:hypothetical protein
LTPDVIVVGSDDCILAVYKVTQTIPVVGVGLSFDLLNLGLIASRAHPGGYVTGFCLANGKPKGQACLATQGNGAADHADWHGVQS